MNLKNRTLSTEIEYYQEILNIKKKEKRKKKIYIYAKYEVWSESVDYVRMGTFTLQNNKILFTKVRSFPFVYIIQSFSLSLSLSIYIYIYIYEIQDVIKNCWSPSRSGLEYANYVLRSNRS